MKLEIDSIHGFVRKNIQRAMYTIGSHFGFLLYNKFNRWSYLQHRPEIFRGRYREMRKLQRGWESETLRNNGGDYARLYFFILNIEQMDRSNIPGAIAEVGVFKGNSAAVLRQLCPDRELFLFDTFEGFSKTDVAGDPSGANAGHMAYRIDHVKKRVGCDDNTYYIPGRFPDTAGRVPLDTRFALVHLDCDLYAPTIAGLEFFYERLSAGGLMIIHDYLTWPGVTQSVDEFLKSRPERVILIPDKSGTVAFVKLAGQ